MANESPSGLEVISGAVPRPSLMRVERYAESDKASWDFFVTQSKNATFLFRRDYMDYHRDRFEDYSLIVRDDDGAIAALLPANHRGHLLATHGGLTYGGFVTDDDMKVPKMLKVFEATLLFLKERSFQRLLYKCIPHIYHRVPAEEDAYALFLCNATLIRRGTLAVVNNGRRLPLQERRRRGARKAEKGGIVVRESKDFSEFWEILSERLLEAFGTEPAHSLAEIELLRSRFPDNIKLFSAYENGAMVAGVVIYETVNVAHAQYIAASPRSREIGALDLIFAELLSTHYSGKKYFDFGTSDECNGRKLNRGLIDQKEGYGARVVAQDQYELDLDAWQPDSLKAAMI